MASNAANTGDAGQLVIVGTEVGYSVAGNWSDISWAIYLNERTEYNYSFGSASASISATVNGVGQGNLWAGSFNFDWRGGGTQSTLIASGTTRFGHYPDGSAAIYLRFDMGSTGTSGAGGPAAVDMWVPWTQLTQVPNTPSAVSSARVSDTQGTVSWTNSGASNGQPRTNQVYSSVNGAAFSKILDINATNTTSVTLAPNCKYQFNVSAWNYAGFSGTSATTPAIFTTPGAPTNAIATKQANLDIKVDWTNNVAYAEYQTEVWHGTVSGGTTTWDGAALATVASGVATYTHAAPNPSNVHVYQVRAKTSSGTVLYSTYAVSNSVQLQAPPNKPTIPAMPAYVDKAQVLTFSWVHNPVDTSAQSAYEFQYSTDGGTTWNGTGKVAGNASSATRPANTYAANVTLTMRVRTWGAATTGGSDGAGASPWSDLKAVTFKTAPTTTITAPANGSTSNNASINVTVTFAQAEAATFVKTTVRVKQGATILEEKDSVSLTTAMATVAQNGQSYTIEERVQDSNGLWSAWVSNTFNVVYLPPVPAGLVATFLQSNGFVQLDLTIPAPGGGQSAATTVTVTRAINGGTPETLVLNYPTSATMTLFDTTAVINGTNTYTITTTSALGAQTTVTQTLVTTECKRAYLSKGTGFSQVVVFGANLSVTEDLSVAQATVQAAGRTKPIGLYGLETSVGIKVSSFVYENFGSTPDQLRAILLLPGKACYRDASGRRVFGTAKGGYKYKHSTRGEFSFSMTETS